MAEPAAFVSKKKSQGHICCVPHCENRWGKDKDAQTKRSYHGFPSDPKRKRQWVNAIPRSEKNQKPWAPAAHHKVCSDHFVDGKVSRKPGTPGYIPTIFPKRKEVKERPTRTSQAAGYAPVPTEPEPEPEQEPAFLQVLIPTPSLEGHEYTLADLGAPCSPYEQARHNKYMCMEEELASSRSRLMSIDLVMDDEAKFMLYTNLPNYAVFTTLRKYLEDRCGGHLREWRGKETTDHQSYLEKGQEKPGKKKEQSFEDQFFMVLVILKSGRFHYDIAREFGKSEAYVSRTFSSWINFLTIELKGLFEMKVNNDPVFIPPCFQDYESLKVVIDCTELITERSSNYQGQKETWSNYKQRDTFKFMVGLSPNMTVNYVSKAYGGRASDKHITLASEAMLDRLNAGSSVMADRGFFVSEELKQMGVKLIIPCFKGAHRNQMTDEECASSAKVAHARVHIERIIQRIRTFHHLDTTVKLAQKDVVEQMFTVCSYLTNYQLPIIAGKVESPEINIPLDGFSIVDMLDL